MEKIDCHLCKGTHIIEGYGHKHKACNFGEQAVNLRMTTKQIRKYNGWKKELKKQQKILVNILKKENKDNIKKDKKIQKELKDKKEKK